MRPSTRPAPAIVKEIRALGLPWLACLVCLTIPPLADAPQWIGGLSAAAYFLGAAALGALSIGHEYNDRTLNMLLSLPVRRERLFATKLGVLAVMLFTLWGVAYTLVFGDPRLPQAAKNMATLLPAMCGLFLAPWLTMVCRNAIGGAVFALAVPAVMLLAGEIIGIRLYGQGAAMEAFRVTFASVGTIGACAVGAVMGWWMFLRLEAIEGQGQAVRLPEWFRVPHRSTSPAQRTKRNPSWLLVQKEIHLQHLSLVLAAFYVLGWLTTGWLATFASDSAYKDTFAALTLPYALLLPILIGASASAAEREMGTLEWQTLLPVAAWKQWAIKAGVVFGVAIAVALGVPAVLLSVSERVHAARIGALTMPAYAIGVVLLLTAGSLYVSSLCRSGLRALVLSMPAMIACMWFLQVVIAYIGIPTYRWAHSMAVTDGHRFAGPRYVDQPGVAYAVTAIFIGIVLRLAYTNHRSADRPGRRVAAQVLVMAAFVIGIVAITAARNGWYRF